jgi:hypothetical protein
VFLIVFISPYLYGYYQYGESLFTPAYTPPRIDFQSNIAGYRLEDSKLYVIMELDNMGEVNITVSSLNASIYSPNGDYITDLKLEKPVEIDAGTKENVTFYMQFTLDTMIKLFKALMAGGQLSVKGILGIDVYSSKVEYPLNIPISFPEDILSNYLNKFEISYVSSEISDNTITVKVEVRNPLGMDFKIVDSNLKLYTADGNYIGDVSTEKNVVIKAGESSYINLYIDLTADVIHRLIEYRSTEYKITGSITVESMNIRLPIQVNIGFKLNISSLIGG